MSVLRTLTILFVAIFSATAPLVAQQSDNQKLLFKQLKTEKNDSIRIYLMSEIAYEYEASSLDNAMTWYRKAMALARKKKSDYWISKIYGYQGIVYQYQSDFDSSILYLSEAIKMAKVRKDTLMLTKNYLNLGKTYIDYDRLYPSMDVYKKALVNAKKLNDSLLISTAYRGIGANFMRLKNYEYALKYHNLSRAINEKRGEDFSLTMDYSNLAIALEELGRKEECEAYYDKGIKLMMKLELQGEELGVLYNNRASFQLRGEKYRLALENFKKAKEQFRFSNNQTSLPFVNKNIAICLFEMKNVDQAKLFLDSALAHISMSVNPRQYIDALYLKAKILKDQKRFEEASAIMIDIYTKKDSLDALMHRREIGELEVRFQTKEKDELIRLGEQEKRQKDIEITMQQAKNERMWAYSIGLGGIGVLLLFLVFNIRRTNKRIQRAHDLIEEQKENALAQKKIIEEKSEEITSSIRYAQHIQNAILPPRPFVEKLFANHFIYYRPKDIVAGDFYWFDEVGDTIFFAAADCTGHGVPGAMVSVVCHNALNQCIREFKLTNSAEILNKTREIVIAMFAKSENNINDGMDISFAVYHKSKKEIQFSGAFNGLLLLRSGAAEFEKFKGDRQHIGFSEDHKPFTSQTIQINSGDRLFMHSDGFPDQFGGKDFKKFKTTSLETLILSIQSFDMRSQQAHLDKAFIDWKGSYEQTDDVCVIGVEIE